MTEKKEVTDPVVLSVIEEFKKRSIFGVEKYGTTLRDNKLSVPQWIQHGIEEAMDLINYLKRLQDFIKEIESLEILRNYSLEELEDIVKKHENEK